MDRGARRATVHRSQRVGHDLVTEQQQSIYGTSLLNKPLNWYLTLGRT